MELLFLALLVVTLACALGSGYPAAFAIPGAAILTIAAAALCGYLFAGDVDAYFVHGEGPQTWLSAGVMNFRGVYRSDARDTLIAIPLFIFMGLMLQRSRVAEDLLLAMAQLFGAIRGGLGISVILVGALLAATTSVIGATVVAMGMISLPTMLRNNYSKPLATGVVAATGTLGQIIPPSIVLLILVHQLTTAVNQANAARRALYKTATGALMMPNEFDVWSVSAGEMFMGALVPGLVLVGLYIFYTAACAFLRPHLAPTEADVTKDGRHPGLAVLVALLPPLALILLVLGSIIAGVATVNQAGAIGAAGATVMAGYRLYKGRRGAFAPTVVAILAMIGITIVVHVFDVNLRRIRTGEDILGVTLAAVAAAFLALALCWSGWRTLKIDKTMKRVVEETTKTTALVFAILLGAVMLTAAFRAFGGEDLVRNFLQELPGGFAGQFAMAMLIIFLLGFFLDFIEISVVVVPIIAPILLADPSANVTAVWLGVMIALNIQTSFLTPPFGFALFYLRGIAPPSVNTIDIYKGVAPFIAIQLVVLCVVGVYPNLVNYLPNRVLLTSDSAPTTTNPRLQYCVETYVARKLREKGEAIREAIRRAQVLDLKVLPEPLRVELGQSFEKTGDVFKVVKAIEKAEHAVAVAAPRYRPLLLEVRTIERDVRRIDQAISKRKVLISRAGATVSETTATQARHEIATMTARRDALLASMPPDWVTVNREFSAIQRAENAARRAFRRTVDAAYRPLRTTLATIGEWKTLKVAVAELRSLQLVKGAEPSVAAQRIKYVDSMLRKIEGMAAIRKALAGARLALQGPSLEPKTAGQKLKSAVALLETAIEWRERAATDVLPQLEAYDAAIADTVGLRGQSRFPDHVAVAVAACSAAPRDIFLNF